MRRESAAKAGLSVMDAAVIVWDIETVPDLKGFAAANGHDGMSDDEDHAQEGTGYTGDAKVLRSREPR
jgi:hypothetical protein